MVRISDRRAGILLALSSLPASARSGVLGKSACCFVDFLAAAGQSLWQILPIGPVGPSLSPYQSSSAFAGNPALIDRKAVRRDPERYAPKGEKYEAFLRENGSWLDDYALFEAVRAAQGGKPLMLWPDEFRNPTGEKLSALLNRYETDINGVKQEQYSFFIQWREFKRYANLKGIGLIGDLPIYVYEDSAEFWLRRGLFDVGRDGRPVSTAGVPPDGFSKTGQVWNNPVYVWDRNRKGILDFWRERLLQAARLYDGVRIDHFRAFADFYAIPADGGGPGEWRPGPGRLFTDMIRREYPDLFVIAEDLGELSAAAEALVRESGFPGMKVLQFAFSGGPFNPHLPHNIGKNAVCYTGTHDNDTLLGWFCEAPRQELLEASGYFGISHPEELPGVMLAQALACRADTAIIPLQDWLGLGPEARMNKPATVGGDNWKWQVPKSALTKSLATRIRRLTKDFYGR